MCVAYALFTITALPAGFPDLFVVVVSVDVSLNIV
jgi:hypothetical protein